ncbi:hypothetical protein [Lactiplantibacillus modestisalitolerans]|uniref:Integral membrane protein n=1 Tax=Lactiplantibacillus modestisalitolerans TaxID=1457219 RepID=A0ABV5WTA1_9LACO|nr:hypothetical protein [Lactiplantibacillus modestisalitolerans]
MKKVTDERLKVRNLKNIRIGFVVENLFLVGVIGWQAFHGRGLAVLSWQNVAVVALLIGSLTVTILGLNVSEPVADKPRFSVRKLIWQGVFAWLVCTLLWYLLIQNQSVVRHVWLALGLGLVIALVWLAIRMYGNHFRQGDDD